MYNYPLIIVIGLSCSGKTTYCKKTLTKSHILYDDFISSFYDGLLIESMQKKENIVVNDPRLCNKATFVKFMEIFEEFYSKNEILLILFENNVEKCIINCMSEDKIKKNLQENIKYNSQKYDVNNYAKYNNLIIPVFDPAVSI